MAPSSQGRAAAAGTRPRRRGPLPRRAVAVAVAVAALVVAIALSILGLLPSAGSHGVDDRERADPAQAPVQGADGPGGEAPAAARPQTQAASLGSSVPSGSADLPLAASGRWQYPDLTGAVLGTAGPLLRYRVAVEQGLPVTVAEFTDVVDSTLGDPRSWIAGRDLRLQRVPAEARYDFTIFLATPATAYRLCLDGGLDIRVNGVPYTSCRAGDNVVINASRYLNGVPDYGAPLEDYRRYVVNHEVGHRLGYGHVLCPGVGLPAPVMQQQTLGLQGCVANGWPYVNGRRYSGPPIS